MAPLTYSQFNPNNPILRNVVFGTVPNKKGLLVKKIIKVIQVDATAKNGEFFIAGVNNGASAETLKRAPTAEMQHVPIAPPTTNTYQVTNRSCQHGPVARKFVNNSQYPERVDRYVGGGLGTAITLDQEAEVQKKLYGTGTGWGITTSLALLPDGHGIAWGNPDCKVMYDLRALKEQFIDNSDMDPEDLVIPAGVANLMAQDSQIQKIAGAARYGDAVAGSMANDGLLARILSDELEIPRVTINRVRKRNTRAGQTYGSGYVASDDSVWMGILNGQGAQTGPEAVMLAEPTALAIFQADALTLESEYRPSRTSWWFFIDTEDAVQVIDPRLGALLHTVRG